MKKALFALMLLCSLIFVTSCGNDYKPQTTHEARWSDDGKDSVVYVQHYDETSHTFTNFVMGYAMFHMLFNTGGYTNVYNNYHANPSYYQTSTAYTKTSSPFTGHSWNTYENKKAWSSPSRSTQSSPHWSSGSSSSSSSSKSYSSPSRSSSSSSRSYSSPSRSSSSPSRSSSSPSRR